MDDAKKFIIKGCATRCLGEDKHKTVISDHYSRHVALSKKPQPLVLLKGHIISYDVENGFTLQGGRTHELINFQVISTAQKSLMIVILLEGKLDFGYDHLTFSLDANHQSKGVVVNLAKPATFHRQLYEDNNVTKLNIVLPLKWIESRYEGSDHIKAFIEQHLASFQVSLNAVMEGLCYDIISSSSPSSLIQRMQLESLTQLLLIKIFEQVSKLDIPRTLETKAIQPSKLNIINTGQKKHNTKRFDQTLDTIMVYIESNLEQPISVHKLTEMASMSLSNLQRKFKSTLGCSIKSYIRRRRLEIAKQQLERGLLSITQAAYNAGYRHPSNFTNAFKKNFGYPPQATIKKAH